MFLVIKNFDFDKFYIKIPAGYQNVTDNTDKQPQKKIGVVCYINFS